MARQAVEFYGRAMIALFLLFVVFTLQYGETQLERIKVQKSVHYGMRQGALTHFTGKPDPNSFDVRLAELFAESLQLKPKFQTVRSVTQLFEELYQGNVDIAIGGLTANATRTHAVLYSQPYYTMAEQIVYSLDTLKPQAHEDLENTRIIVPTDSSYIQTLKKMQKKHPLLQYETRDANTFDLLDEVTSGKIDYTVADSLELAEYRRLNPNVHVGLVLLDDQNIAWAVHPFTRYPGLSRLFLYFSDHGFFPDFFRKCRSKLPQDKSLLNAINQFLEKIERSGELDWLIDASFAMTDFNFVDLRTFHRRIQHFLPLYEPYFRAAGNPDVEWELLAALAYQESHWNSNAESPTGVRGIMMLTQNTALSVGVNNRLDPGQSIRGGTQYFRQIRDKLPSSIVEPDRTWIALASYNIGPAHIKDVQTWVTQQGKDPNRWQDIRALLPKKQDPTWYKRSKYGKARGNEAVNYVDNIRTYYDILKSLQSTPNPL